MLAIECDGATYHSALWARERDRLRQEVLEGLGWRIHRIWSTDWFYRRDQQMRKLKAAVIAAGGGVEEPSPAAAPGARETTPKPRLARSATGRGPTLANTVLKPDSAEPENPSEIAPKLRSYALAKCKLRRGAKIERVGVQRLAGIAREVIKQEGPIRQDEIMRRVGSFFGRGRLSFRAATMIAAALDLLLKETSEVRCDEGFWFTHRQNSAPQVRGRAGGPARLRKPDMIAAIEIKAAIALAQTQARPGVDLADAVAKLFGLRRAASDMRTRILACAKREPRSPPACGTEDARRS